MENIVRLTPGETYRRNTLTGSEPLSHEATIRDRLMGGRHALNVEIEVRVLVPKCRSKSGSATPSHDDFDRITRYRFGSWVADAGEAGIGGAKVSRGRVAQ